MVVWEGEAQKGGFGGGTLVTRGRPCPLAPHYRQPSAAVLTDCAALAHEPVRRWCGTSVVALVDDLQVDSISSFRSKTDPEADTVATVQPVPDLGGYHVLAQENVVP